MRYSNVSLVYLWTLALLAFAAHQSNATLGERLWRRQSGGDLGAPETATVSNQGQQAAGVTQQPPPRLYPDLQRDSAFPPQPYEPYYRNRHAHSHGPTPFVPFGLQVPTNRFNEPLSPTRPMVPGPMTSSDRLQSQTFVNGLGRRLLSIIGVADPPSSGNETAQPEAGTTPSGQGRSDSREAMMKALQNSTVLQQLNRGVHSIYDNLSRMYNSTVQQQLNLLQERYKKEAENSTAPWQQRMAQQVPQFFKSVAVKVGEAQENLNRIWRQVGQANNGTGGEREMSAQQAQQAPPQSRSFLNSFVDQIVGPNPFEDAVFQPGPPYNGFNDRQDLPANQAPRSELGGQLMNFWHNQVQPQIGMIRGQVARVWRDLTSSGAFMPMDPMVRARANGNNLGTADNENGASTDVLDDILKGLDMNGGENSQQAGPRSQLGSQIQARVINLQRELNQLWYGLTSSLQGAIGNVRNALNPRPQFNPMSGAESMDNKQEVDPAENEIDGKIKNLSKLQKDADNVYDVVQQQQQRAQRTSFTDRLRGFFDFGGSDQGPNRFGESMSRFGTAVGDLWNQLPRRWDDFMQNVRPKDQMTMANDRLMASSTTNKPNSVPVVSAAASNANTDQGSPNK